MSVCVCVLSIAEVFLSSLIFPGKMAIATDPDPVPSVWTRFQVFVVPQ